MKIATLIFLLAISLRTMDINSHPSGFTPDEASFGYDAYSILKTGKDQWGNKLPLTLKSFGDGKMPIYSYLTIPSTAIFGLSKFSVRFPNAILGSLAILITYFLVLEFSKNKKLALFSSFLLAISPWHIPMSRGAFEANLTTFLLPAAILFFLKGTKKSIFFVPASIFFGLNLFSYHSARLISPLLMFYLLFKFRKNIKYDFRTAISSGILILFVVGALYTYLNGAGSRLSSASIFKLANQAGEDRYNAVLTGTPDIIARIFNNKATKIFSIFTSNYLSYFSPQFLLTQGPAEGTYGMIPGHGVLYLIEGVFILGFLFALFSKRIKIPGWIIVWLIIAPIPAALSIGPGYAANRADIAIPAIQVALAIGAIFIYEELKYKKLALIFYSTILIFSFIFFLEDYFVQQTSRSKDMIYGAPEISSYLKEVDNQYNEIIVSKSISEPQIYIAFFQLIDPVFYQQNSKNWDFQEQGLTWVDQMPSYSLGKYTFKGLDYKLDSKLSKALLVGTPGEFPKDSNIIYKVKYPNQKDAYWVVSTNE